MGRAPVLHDIRRTVAIQRVTLTPYGCGHSPQASGPSRLRMNGNYGNFTLANFLWGFGRQPVRRSARARVLVASVAFAGLIYEPPKRKSL